MKLQLHSVTGLKLWIDNQTKPVAASTTLELPKGTHNFIFFVGLDRREGLRAQFDEVSESLARFQLSRRWGAAWWQLTIKRTIPDDSSVR